MRNGIAGDTMERALREFQVCRREAALRDRIHTQQADLYAPQRTSSQPGSLAAVVGMLGSGTAFTAVASFVALAVVIGVASVAIALVGASVISAARALVAKPAQRRGGDAPTRGPAGRSTKATCSTTRRCRWSSMSVVSISIPTWLTPLRKLV